MPTYEYKREDGTTFEVRQSINADPLEKCPDTGQKVQRVITGGGGVVYKGDGWYVTDYKNNDRPQNGSKKHSSGDETTSENKTTQSGKTSGNGSSE